MSKSPLVSRRDFHRLAAAGVLGASATRWMEPLARAAVNDPQRRRSCILSWMNGGPSQTDTFDLKPGHANGGPFQAIETATPGVRISEHLPKLARETEDMAIV